MSTHVSARQAGWLGKEKRRNKYGARRTFLDGRWFDSAAEAKRYTTLRLLERAGCIRDLKCQPAFRLYGAGGTLVCSYRADFQYDIVRADGAGRRVVEDVKGKRTEAYKIKARLFADNHGFEVTEIDA